MPHDPYTRNHMSMSCLFVTGVSNSSQSTDEPEIGTTATTTEVLVEENYTSPGYRVLMKEMQCSIKYETLNCDSIGFEEMPQATTIPDDIEFADFRNNRLSSLCGGIFYGGRQVKALYFANNQIFHLESNTFTNLSSITHLDLSHNYLVHIPVEAFNGMLQLNTIDLGYNKIMYLSRDVFLQTKGPFFLKELRLNHNELRELDHDLFEHLFHMDALDLEDNVLEHLPDLIFARNPRLRDLKLSMNHFEYVPTNALRSAKVLDILDLSSNRFKEIRYQDFAHLMHLTRLRISRVMSLERIHRHAFQDLVNLRQLTIEYNRKLREIHEMAFTHNVTGELLDELTEVSFKGNALSTLSPNTLMWTMIQELDFSDNPWRCDCNLRWIVNLTVNERTEENYVCKQPYKHFNQRITDMTEEDFSCSFFENDVFIVGGCLLIILLMTGLTSIGFLIAKLKIIPKIVSVFSRHPKSQRGMRVQAGTSYSRVDPSSVETVVSIEYQGKQQQQQQPHHQQQPETRSQESGSRDSATRDASSSGSLTRSARSGSCCSRTSCTNTRHCTRGHGTKHVPKTSKKVANHNDATSGIACTKV